MPKHYFRVKIAKGSKLPKYEQELKATLQVGGGNQLNELVGFSRSLFQDCLTFVKFQTKSVNALPVTLELVRNQGEFNIIEKRIAEFAHRGEKPKYPPLALILWSELGGTVFVNFGFFYNLLRNNDCQTFIITLTDNYLHELVHYFYKCKTEQEVHDTQCTLLETFLGVTLPIEAKTVQSSEFYHKKEDK